MPAIAEQGGTGASMVGQMAADPGQGPGGAGAGQPSPMEAMKAISALSQQADSLAQQFPMIADQIPQLKAILRQMVVKASQGAPTQNRSAGMLPTGT